MNRAEGLSIGLFLCKIDGEFFFQEATNTCCCVLWLSTYQHEPTSRHSVNVFLYNAYFFDIIVITEGIVNTSQWINYTTKTWYMSACVVRFLKDNRAFQEA